MKDILNIIRNFILGLVAFIFITIWLYLIVFYGVKNGNTAWDNGRDIEESTVYHSF